VIQGEGCGSCIVDLGTGAPFAALGDPTAPGLRFVRAPTPVAPDLVPVVPAAEAAVRAPDGHRFLAVSVTDVADLALVAVVEPDFLVLASRLLHGDDGGHGRATLAALSGYARARGIHVVAVGIPDREAYDALRHVGVRYGAGPYVDRHLELQRPLAVADSPPGRLAWLRARLAHATDAGTVAAAACDHVADIGLLPSVYVERHGVLRCIAQRGYWQVMDGIPVDLGVLGRTFRLGRTIHVEAADDPDFIAAVPGLVAELAIPIRVGGRVRAVFSVEGTRSLRAADVHEVERVAAELEDALQRTGIEEQLGGLHALVRAGAELAALADETAVAHAAVRHACAVAGTSSAMIALPSADGRDLLQAAAGPLAPALQRLDPTLLRAFALELGEISSCMAGGDEDGRVHPVFQDVRRSGGTSLSVFPVRCGSGEPGLLFAVDHVPGGLGAEAREATELLAGTVARTVDHVRAHAALRFRAERDPLTAVGNRGAFDDALGQLDAAARRGDRVAVLLVDIDRFKQVNDRYGHVAGDQVLVDAARALLECLRPDDRLYRIGGDEFAVIVPGIDRRAADDLGRRLVDRARVHLEPVGADMSVGVAVRQLGEAMTDCILRADDALYAAKADRAPGRSAAPAARASAAPDPA